VPPVLAVVGSANADLYLGVPRLPAPGDTVLAAAAHWLPGGKGANQASAAARLGASVAFVGAVGDDAAAEVALGGLADAGVDVSAVRRIAGHPTGVAVVTVDNLGENAVVVAAGANAALRADDVAVPPSCAAVLVSLEIAGAAAERALQAAHDAGALAVLNAAPADACTPTLLDLADVVVGNEGEAAAIAHGRGLAELAATTKATVVVTAGPAGVRAATPAGGELHVPALPVDVVDTVGAGDCFTAALVVALAEDRPLEAALRFATAAASLAVGAVGARSTPHRADVDALLGPNRV